MGTLQETPQQKRARLEAEAKKKRAEIVRKKDSIIQRNVKASGSGTREAYRQKLAKDSKKPDAKVEGLMTNKANKRGATKGSCSTGTVNKGESLRDNK